MAFSGSNGWDAQVYWKAIQSVRHGVDPYATGLAAQQAYHERAHTAADRPPFTYVYSPITLPLLRVLGTVPSWVLAILYAAAQLAGFLLVLWVGYQMASREERPWLALLLPFVGFFPGLLCDDVILSGNVVYALYGAIFAAAFLGWSRGKWLWYYLAVLAASVCKVPLLTLLAFPVLVGRRQWFASIFTGATGLALFSVQARIWPDLFREYMLAVKLQFDWNHDFGFGPAGVLGQVLWDMRKPYSPATTIAYLIFATALGIGLLFLARMVREGKLPQEQWIPVALVGTILLNPRVKEYDVAVITVPMLLIAWRMIKFGVSFSPGKVHGKNSLAGGSGRNQFDFAVVLAASGWFTAFNILAGEVSWRPTEMGLLLGVFLLGVGSLYCVRQEAVAAAVSRVPPAGYPEEVSEYAVLG